MVLGTVKICHVLQISKVDPSGNYHTLDTIWLLRNVGFSLSITVIVWDKDCMWTRSEVVTFTFLSCIDMYNVLWILMANPANSLSGGRKWPEYNLKLFVSSPFLFLMQCKSPSSYVGLETAQQLRWCEAISEIKSIHAWKFFFLIGVGRGW
jgi:hypothetical protein